jgi:hypothetical protein
MARFALFSPKSHLAAVALAVAVGLAATPGVLTIVGGSAAAQTAAAPDVSAASLGVVMDFLSNTSPDKVEAAAAANRLVASDATYVSLNFDNPELKQIEPWTGTAHGPSAYSSTFLRVAKYWKI